MLQFLSITLLVLIASAFSYEDEVKSPVEITEELRRTDTQDAEEERIAGGAPAEDGQFPYAAALLREGKFSCTASIISPRTVLTAAHCLVSQSQRFPPSAFSAVVGAADRTSQDAVTIYFEALYVHERYNARNQQHDIAILKTTAPIPMSDKIKQIVIAASGTGMDDYNKATVMGWGATLTPVTYPNVLNFLNVTILPHVTCMARFPGTVTTNMICADKFGGGICFGDSGGPMVHLGIDQRPDIQLGVASFMRTTNMCRSADGSPGVETRVSSYEQWIRERAQDPDIISMTKQN